MDATSIEHDIRTLAEGRSDLWTASACGVTRSQRAIPALLHREAYSTSPQRTRVLIVAGLSAQPADVEMALATARQYSSPAWQTPDAIALSVVPCANLDGLELRAAPENGAGGSPESGYPPDDGYFYHKTDPEKRYLWRWICYQAPDLVISLGFSDTTVWEANTAAHDLGNYLGASSMGPGDGLLQALGADDAGGLGAIPGLHLSTTADGLRGELERLWGSIAANPPGPSAAGAELDRRRSRSPLEIGRALASPYGHRLDPIIYTQGVAMSGRLRLALLDDEVESPAQEFVSLVSPYMAHDFFAYVTDASALGALVWADELTDATGDPRYAALLVEAGNVYRRASEGKTAPILRPDYIVEDMFQISSVLGRAFSLTGDEKYLDVLTKFLLDMETQQEDGLYWHGRNAHHYWGRGNGFASMGLAESLTYMSPDYTGRGAILAKFVALMEAMRRHQEPSGMWRQVVDFPGTYQEFTATCMTGYAMARGVRMGWLDEGFEETVALAWQGISDRIEDSGKVVDACFGSGTNADVQYYLDRPAVSGFDDRGGSMALWFTAEMERLRRKAGSRG
jgi:rhamnogalacturonyl hydrolase YesR